MKKTIEKYILENSLKYGSAKPKTVLGKVLSEMPELRKDATRVLGEVESEIKRLEKLSDSEKEELLSQHSFTKKERKKSGLPELVNAKNHEVVLRFAPNPSGPLHLGHARAAILNDEYAKRYKGKLILRIEDTDPKRVDPNAYDLIEQDLRWLGCEVSETVVQSKRIKVYEDIATRLIKDGHSYLCTCDPESFRELKRAKKACDCRGLDAEENLRRWEKMKSGKEKDIVVMLKTDIKHANPALRDFPVMRTEDAEHPFSLMKSHVYPLYNFAVVVDDHLLGVTHVLRGKDHIVNTERQRFVYKYLKWKEPEFIHYGLMSIGETLLSTSEIREGIENNTYTGWDDARVGTLLALRRRGIQPEAIRSVMKSLGCGSVDVRFEWENLYAENKKLIEKKANRYYFVPDPVEIWVEGVPEDLREIDLALHPDFPERGYRRLILNNRKGRIKIFIAKEDMQKIRKGTEIRLKNFINIKFKETSPPVAEYVERNIKVDKIQFLPEEVIGCEVMTPTGNIAGFAEKTCGDLTQDEMIQFERFGFCRVDKADRTGIICYFAHR